MKYLVISDIHGILEYASKIDDIVLKEKPNKIILLGDLYDDYSDKKNIEVSYILNKYKDIILCTRGNCDNEFDESISDFNFKDYIELNINNKNFFFTHGHLYNLNNIPDYVDVFIFGHIHRHLIDKINNLICVNTGSLSKPRGNTKHSYVIIDNNITIKDIEGNNIDSIIF